MKEYWKLSEYIEYLQGQLEKYGDGEVYSLGEFAEHEPPPSIKCEWDEECDYEYDEKKDELIEKVTVSNVHYYLY